MSRTRAQNPAADHDRVRSLLHDEFAPRHFAFCLFDVPVFQVNSVRGG